MKRRSIVLLISFCLILASASYLLLENIHKQNSIQYVFTKHIMHLAGYWNESKHALDAYIRTRDVLALEVIKENIRSAGFLIDVFPYLDEKHQQEWTKIKVISNELEQKLQTISQNNAEEDLNSMKDSLHRLNQILPDEFTIGEKVSFNFEHIDRIKE